MCQKNIAKDNLILYDKSASTVVCSRCLRNEEYAPAFRIRKLIPDSAPTLFKDYPIFYMISSA